MQKKGNPGFLRSEGVRVRKIFTDFPVKLFRKYSGQNIRRIRSQMRKLKYARDHGCSIRKFLEYL